MSNLENKLKKIVNTFNNIDKNLAYEDIKKLSTKYHKNINKFIYDLIFQVFSLYI